MRSVSSPMFRSWCQAPGGDRDPVALTHAPTGAVELQLALALEDEVDLLRLGVVMALRRLARLQRRFGEALVDRAAGRQAAELADRAPVRSHERRRRGQRADVH